jgi:hypothetical protein
MVRDTSKYCQCCKLGHCDANQHAAPSTPPNHNARYVLGLVSRPYDVHVKIVDAAVVDGESLATWMIVARHECVESALRRAHALQPDLN